MSSISTQAKSIWISLDPASPGKCNNLQLPCRVQGVCQWLDGESFKMLLYSFALYLGSVQAVVEDRLHDGKADPARVSAQRTLLSFFHPILNFVWLFIVLFFRRTLLISLDFSDLHLLFFAFMFLFPLFPSLNPTENTFYFTYNKGSKGMRSCRYKIQITL